MAKVLAVGGPKGGVGKTTCALNIAVYAARVLGLQVLLMDADPNHSAVDAVQAAGDRMPFDVRKGYDHESLVILRDSNDYDLIVVDLPGAREVGAMRALLEPTVRVVRSRMKVIAVDAVVLPTRPEVMDVRPLRRVVEEEIQPLNVPYLIVFVQIHGDRVEAALARREELVAMGLHVAGSMTRALVAHDDALEQGQPLMDLPGGRRSVVRAADREYRRLTYDALALLGFDATAVLDEETNGGGPE